MKKAQNTKAEAKIYALMNYSPELEKSLRAILFGREQILCQGWKISDNGIEQSLIVDSMTWKNGPVVEMLHSLISMKTVDTIYVLEEHKSTLPQREAFHKRYLTRVAGFEVENVDDIDSWIQNAQEIIEDVARFYKVHLRIYLKLSPDGTLVARLFDSDRGHLQTSSAKNIPKWEKAVASLTSKLNVASTNFWQMRYCSIGEYTSEYIQGYLNKK
ncbi:MAG: hypothetical protein R3Y43_03085 [Alphaproteobacteria bacterium]